VAMLAKNFRRLMKNDKFKKKKFSERQKKALRESEPKEAEKDPRGLKSFECLGFGHIWIDCGNLK
jgi:hypothetical protein